VLKVPITMDDDDRDRSLCRLPKEVLLIIFTYLNESSVEASTKTCLPWQRLISNSPAVWKSLILQLCTGKPSLRPMLDMSLYKDVKRDSVRLKCLFQHMSRIEQNVKNNLFSVKVFDCLSVNVKGQTVKRNEEWEKTHNYKGLYDMIHSGKRLIASVYDTIQVWDMESYTCEQMLDSSALDIGNVATTCFAVHQDTLLCGCENGYIKLFDIISGKFLSKTRRNSNFISDLSVNGDTLISVDWFGEVSEWNIKGQALYAVAGDDRYQAPAILGRRHAERLLDFNEEHLVTTYMSHLTCYRKGEFYRSYPTISDVFCISLLGDLLSFGCKGGDGGPVAGIMHLSQPGPPALLYINTPDKDPVISISFSADYLILGDINGELHVVNISEMKFPSAGETSTVELGKDNEVGITYIGTIRSHQYGSFVWAVKSDSYRIFSGDDTGKIIVHDFLKLEEPVHAVVT